MKTSPQDQVRIDLEARYIQALFPYVPECREDQVYSEVETMSDDLLVKRLAVLERIFT